MMRNNNMYQNISRKRKIPVAMKFSKSALNDLKNTVGKYPAETGGMLLGDVNKGVVVQFVFDNGENQRRSGAAYDPDYDFLNQQLEVGRSKGLELVGFVHSHPRGVSRLSGDYGRGVGDVGYLKTILKAMPELDYLFTPIVYSTADGQPFEIFPYVAERGREAHYESIPIYYGEELLSTGKPFQHNENKQQQNKVNQPNERIEVSSLSISDVARLKIKNNLNKFQINAGGMLIGNMKTKVISDFVFDAGLQPEYLEKYDPDISLFKQCTLATDQEHLGLVISNDAPISVDELKTFHAFTCYLKACTKRELFYCITLNRNSLDKVFQVFSINPNNGYPLIKLLPSIS